MNRQKDINSGENAVIFDLEKQILVRDGLSNVPYGGVVEGYFNASELSHDLDKKFKRFRDWTGEFICRRTGRNCRPGILFG